MRLRGRREGVRRLRVAGGGAERPLRLVGLNVGVSSATRVRAAAILSRNYDITVDEIYLVQLHPNLSTWKQVEVLAG